MDFGAWWLKRKERAWIELHGEIPDGYMLSFGPFGLFSSQLINIRTGQRHWPDAGRNNWRGA